MVALHKDSASKVTARRDAVDPGDGVLAGRPLRKCKELIDPMKLFPAIFNPAGNNGSQVNLRPGDQAGEPHAADGRGEPFSIFDRTTDEPRPVGSNQFEADHMTPESPGHVMILAVNIVRDGAAHSYVFRTRSYRQKEPAWNRKVQDLLQRRSCLAAQHPRRSLEMQQPIHARGLQQHAVLQQADVAITAAHPNRQLSGARRVRQRKIAGPVERNHISLEFGITTPGFEARGPLG